MSYVDRDERYRFNNRAYEQWFGRDRDEIRGMTVADLVGVEAYENIIRARLRRALAGETVHYEQLIPYRGGAPRYVEATYVPDRDARGAVKGIVVMLQDISDRKRAEAARQQANRLLDGVVNNTHLLMACLDTELNFLWVNRAYAEADGRRPEDFPGKKHFALYPDAENESIFREVVATGKARFFEAKSFEHKQRPQRGVSYWNWGLIPIKDDAGKVERLVLTLLDVTGRVKTEEALRQERNLLSAVLENVGALIIVCDREGRPVRFNRACEQVTGYRFEEVRDTPFWDRLLVPEEADAVREVFRRLRAREYPSVHENYWVTKDGRRRWIRWANTVVLGPDNEVQYVIGTGIDQTELRAASERAREREQELAHAARVGVVSEMASGLTHEISQPLTAIASYAQECERRLRAGEVEPDTLLAAVEQVLAQARRAAGIIHNLRDFLSKRPSQAERMDINAIVRRAAELAQPEARRLGLQLRLQLDDRVPATRGDPVQVEQVVLNLLRNSMEALQATPPDKREIGVQTRLDGRRDIEVSVSDTGPGLGGVDPERVFERFYTTKTQGMGMGLSLSRTIVEAHGGRIWAAPGHTTGSVFRFTLPISH